MVVWGGQRKFGELRELSTPKLKKIFSVIWGADFTVVHHYVRNNMQLFLQINRFLQISNEKNDFLDAQMVSWELNGFILL